MSVNINRTTSAHNIFYYVQRQCILSVQFICDQYFVCADDPGYELHRHYVKDCTVIFRMSMQFICNHYFVCTDDKDRLCRICIYDLYRFFKELCVQTIIISTVQKIQIVREDYEDCLYIHKIIICADDNDYHKSETIQYVRVVIKDSQSCVLQKDYLQKISTKI